MTERATMERALRRRRAAGAALDARASVSQARQRARFAMFTLPLLTGAGFAWTRCVSDAGAPPPEAVNRVEASAASQPPREPRRHIVRAAPLHVVEVARKPLESAPPASPMAKPAALPTTGGERIEGRVMDAVGGPVAGAVISAFSDQWSPQLLGTTESSDDGSFSLSVAEGDARVAASAPGYSRTVQQVRAPSTAVVLVLAPASSLAGRVVVSGSNTGVEGAVVTVSDVDATRVSLRTTTTAADGSFLFPDLAAGSYRLKAVHERWSSAEHRAALGLGESSAELVLPVLPATHLTGVLRIGDAPCVQAEVLLEGPKAAFGVTDPAGVVEILGLEPGSYQATLRCPGALLHRETIVIQTDPVAKTWQLDPGLALTGAAQRADGTPLAHVQVMVAPVREPAGTAAEAAPANAPAASTPLAAAHTCRSDERGEFACTGLAPGEYDCKLSGVKLAAASLRRVSLAPGSAPHVVLQAPAEGTIRVTWPAGGAPPPGVVVLARAAGERSPSVAARRGAAFVFDAVPLGEHEVYVDGAPGPAQHARISEDGELVELTLPLPPSSSIAGRVLDERGEGLMDTWVRAVPDPERVGALLAATEPVLTDERGAFSLEPLSPGRYRLEASSLHGQAILPGIPAGATNVQLRLTGEAASAAP